MKFYIFRGISNYVILDGLLTKKKNSEVPSVEHHSTYHHNYYKDQGMMKKLISGLSASLPSNCTTELHLLISKNKKISEKLYISCYIGHRRSIFSSGEESFKRILLVFNLDFKEES